MTTQLRLVEPPEPRPRSTSSRSSRRVAASTAAKGRGRTARTVASVRTGRRAASWGEWHLDARTRQVGRAGVARAREALEAVLEHELRAS